MTGRSRPGPRRDRSSGGVGVIAAAFVVAGLDDGVANDSPAPCMRPPARWPPWNTPARSVGNAAESVHTTSPTAPGYFKLRPVSSAKPPTNSEAAEMVHYSTWEPRQQNDQANGTTAAHVQDSWVLGMENHAAVFGRVDGQFTGTTDEIIQWAAAKWGLPDNLIRAEAVVESYWYQDNRNSDGHPISGEGYGDFGSCGGSPPPSSYGANGPASFGDDAGQMVHLEGSLGPWIRRLALERAVHRLQPGLVRSCHTGLLRGLGHLARRLIPLGRPVGLRWALVFRRLVHSRRSPYLKGQGFREE